jgi:uncharacterized membrane-anchored protein
MAEPTKRGTGWIVFAGVLMVLAGADMFINGIWALKASQATVNTFKGQLLFSDTNLDTWGWIYLIIGAVVLVAGICVFARQHWAVTVGIVAALVQAIFGFFWLFTPYWQAAIIVIALDLFVIYGLSTYGDRQLA